MSDWYRNGRDDERRGFGDDGGRRREMSDRDRWSERNGYGTELRSFDEAERAYSRNYGAGYVGRGLGREDVGGREAYGARDYGSRTYDPQGYGSQDSQRYGSQGYGSQGYGSQGYGYGGGYGAEGYGGAYSGREPWRGGDYRRAMDEGYGYQRDRGYRADARYGDEEGQRRMGEHRGRGPKSYTRSDDRIREDVNDRLTDDPRLDASDIEVQVKDCEVTLAGQVRSREDKRRAEDIVEDVSGVKHVQCNLRIQAQAGQALFGQSAEHGARTTPGGATAQGRTAGNA
jgi:osmotically-inducible protein OsmY